MGAVDPAQLNLDVYDTKQGVWNPDHGELELPNGWVFLATGDTYVTRHVKAAGVYWTVWRPRSKDRAHRRKLGLFAPAAAIEAAQREKLDTAERRAKQRIAGARQRDRAEDKYRAEFEAAVRRWLAFAAEHAALADEIAAGAAERAAVVGSRRVGRTKTLTLEERAALAARAFIRHRYTQYENHLVEIDTVGSEVDSFEYRDIKQEAHSAVDAFLDAHRQH